MKIDSVAYQNSEQAVTSFAVLFQEGIYTETEPNKTKNNSASDSIRIEIDVFSFPCPHLSVRYKATNCGNLSCGLLTIVSYFWG